MTPIISDDTMRDLTVKILLTILLVIPNVPALAQERAAPVFFQSLSDVPIMPGLRELTGQTVIFDKPEGRIVEMTAVSDSVGVDSVQSFYEASLPQVGWHKIGPHSYAREGERLTLSFDPAGGQNFVRFNLVPAP